MKKYVWYNNATGCYELNKNVTEQYAYGYFNAIENILEEYNIESLDELEKLLKKATKGDAEIMENKKLEALKDLEVINNYGCGINDNMKFSEVFEKEYTTIKQALTTKSKKEQAFEIIKEKNVNTKLFKKRFIENPEFADCYKDDFNYYENIWIAFSYELLTREEFDLLKEVLSNE